MRLCRFRERDEVSIAFYDEETVTPIRGVAEAYAQATGESLRIHQNRDLLALLPPDGREFAAMQRLASWMSAQEEQTLAPLQVNHAKIELLVPIPRPAKLFLLAGNYAKHIEEGGGIAAERAETFPYVFMKPPTTTLTDPGKPIRIPSVSPHHIDWELELAVIMGRECKAVRESEALNYVAGYTVINDISDRKFRPNPNRKPREKDSFFDWLHGKWHDSFCPCGPCVASADSIADPQSLSMQLRVNGEVHQSASTGQQIFPVAAVIEFISSFVTLEPGDMISTGTPAGVGNTTGTYLKSGDEVEATISSIGTLRSPVT